MNRLPAATRDCDALPPTPPPPRVTAKVRGEFLKNNTVIQDVWLDVADDAPVRGFVIRPKRMAPDPGAVLFVHLLGAPPDNDRTEFFDDALALADANVVSLLADAPWASPDWFTSRALDQDLPHVLRYAAVLRGYLRFLEAESKAAPGKLALAAHDFGAMYGALALRNEPTVRHAVLMAAVPDFADWFLLGRQLKTAEKDAYRMRMLPVMPAAYLRCAATSNVLFQFAENDRFVTVDQASAFAASAPADKQVLWYAGGHELQGVSRNDRIAWLRAQVGRRF